MKSATTMTMIKILETIPKELQEQVVEHMRYYIEDILEETKWAFGDILYIYRFEIMILLRVKAKSLLCYWAVAHKKRKYR
jgi:hypothetical protein